MDKPFKTTLCCAALVLAVSVLSGCSTVSDVASSSVTTLAKLNPFSASAQTPDIKPVVGANTVPEPTPTPTPEPVVVQTPIDAPVAEGKVFRVSAPVAPPKAKKKKPAAKEVESTLAGNKECTTFCALPGLKQK